MKVYQRKCVSCKDKFTPQNNTQICCSPSCAIDYMKKKQSKDWQNQKKIIKQSLETKSDVLKAAQIVFNNYIRARDKGKPCISCGKVLKENDVNASHFFSVGSSPNLRFNEDNVHSSCIRCNKELHGNSIEYALRLPNRIGVKRYNQLLNDRNKPALLTIDDVKELIAIYKVKTKEINALHNNK
jgi:hypothetical protein